MDEDTSKKRPRSTSPLPSSTPGKRKARLVSEDNEIAKKLRDPSQRNHALNHLLSVTNSDLSYTLEDGQILQALADIFFETLGWYKLKPSRSNSYPSFLATQAWAEHATPEGQEWAAFCSRQLAKGRLGKDDLKLLEALLVILRNLSFVAANHRLLAYSPDTLSVLVGALYETTSTNVGSSEDTGVSNTSSAIATNAVHALVNLAPYLDVTGQKLLCDKLFLVNNMSEEIPALPAASDFGQVADGKFGFGSLWLAKRLDTKEDIVSDVSNDMIFELTRSYLFSVWAVFPALLKVLTDSSAPRSLLMMAVELLQEFIVHARSGPVESAGSRGQQFPTARSILVNTPAAVLQRLVDLLYIPRLGSDSLDYVDPTICIVTRVNTLRMMLGYDATVDTDLRDRALDVLVPLLELDSADIAQRLGVSTTSGVIKQLLDSVLPILTTQVGRSEAPSLAVQLLKELSKADGIKVACSYTTEKLVELASTDAKIAHLALNFMI